MNAPCACDSRILWQGRESHCVCKRRDRRSCALVNFWARSVPALCSALRSAFASPSAFFNALRTKEPAISLSWSRLTFVKQGARTRMPARLRAAIASEMPDIGKIAACLREIRQAEARDAIQSFGKGIARALIRVSPGMIVRALRASCGFSKKLAIAQLLST